MKKISYILASLALVMGSGIMLTSCGDNDNFSKLHYLTDEEIQEMARQDSLKAEALKGYKVDKMIDREVSFTISANGYDGCMMEIPFDEIGEVFGMTGMQVRQGLEDGSVQGFAIEEGTHSDFLEASNTNGIWGHWWDENGNITSWGDDARVFAEYYGINEEDDNPSFSIGQMPGKLVAGQKYQMIECLKYQDKRVGLRIIVTPKEPASVSGDTYAFEQTVQAQYCPNTTYAPTFVEFDRDAVLAKLGVASIAETTLLAKAEDGSLSGAQTGGNGFWMTETGAITGWGDNSAIFIEYHGEEDPDIPENCLSVGNFPDWTQPEGWSTTCDFAFMANDKVAMIHINITIIGYVDPEDKPGTTPADTTVDVALEATMGEPWPYAAFDIRDILKNAFNLTTHEIFVAKNNQEIEVYLNSINPEGPDCNGNYGEYWVTTEGLKDEQGYPNAPIYLGLEGDDDYWEIGMGINSDTFTTSSVVNFTSVLYLVYQGTTVTCNISATINPAPAE